jgi:BirA family biotin operon repressor/biotin-[acetyl-CoA-carboxylase] ligase
VIIGREIVRHALVDSTMDALDELALAGVAEGVVVLADEQALGRGRGGRSWAGRIGGVYCSILLRPRVSAQQLGLLSLVAGVAVAEALDRIAPVRCRLKWPNDVVIGHRKVAGILIQTRLNAANVDYVNVGIGINVAQPIESLPSTAVTLRMASGDPSLTVETVLPALFGSLDRHYRDFVASEGRPALEGWRARAAFVGEQVTITQATQEIRGRLDGIDHFGRLLLTTDEGSTLAIVQGDLVRGPRRIETEFGAERRSEREED